RPRTLTQAVVDRPGDAEREQHEDREPDDQQDRRGGGGEDERQPRAESDGAAHPAGSVAVRLRIRHHETANATPPSAGPGRSRRSRCRAPPPRRAALRPLIVALAAFLLLDRRR